MQYIENSMVGPYRRRPLTHSNCAIHVEKQVRLYAEWAQQQGLETIHIFPPKRNGNARWTYNTLLEQDLAGSVRLVEVDPEDWK